MRVRMVHDMSVRGGRGARGFTLVELLVVVLVIAILASIVLVSVLVVNRNAQAVADTQAARGMATAATQFETDNGFAVPLVYDGAPLDAMGIGPPKRVRDGLDNGRYEWLDDEEENAPVLQSTGTRQVRFVAVYEPAVDVDFFRGGKDAGGSADVVSLDFSAGGLVRDARYSKFSLPVYLSGVYGREIDGVEGPGMTRPLRDGTFAGVVGRGAPTPVDAFVDPGQDTLRLEATYADRLEALEFGAAMPQEGRPYTAAFVDRYGRAFRYYRWAKGRNTRDADTPTDIGNVEHARDRNIPFVLQDFGAVLEALSDDQVDATGGDAELGGATWAIVGAGPDGRFGTEPMSDLDPAGSASGEAAVAAWRARSQRDNVVILGR